MAQSTNATKLARAAALRRSIADAQEQMAALDRIPDADTYADRTVVFAVVSTGSVGVQLDYVFLKVSGEGGADDRWYFTGELYGMRRNGWDGRWVTWKALVQWLSSVVTLESWEIFTPKEETA